MWLYLRQCYESIPILANIRLLFNDAILRNADVSDRHFNNKMFREIFKNACQY